MTYRRDDIDGLRAVAVLGVIAYHFGAHWLPGGFTGVDVFFVISGFVITLGLRRRVANGEHTIAKFYDRRVRRIFPATFVVLVSSLIAGYFVLMPGDFASTGASAAISAVAAGNLYFFWNTGYFDQAAELQPLLHMWSLGVEEQFYFVWPFVLPFFIRITRGRPRNIALLILALCVVSFALATFSMRADPKAAFYLPHLRAWELAAGGLLVYLPKISRTSVANLAALAGLALIGWSYLALSSGVAFPGPAAVPTVAGAGLLIWAGQSTVIAKGLSLRPVVFIGTVSFSLYLWHWPVLVLFRHYNNSLMPSAIEAGGLALLTLGLSVLTWRFVEQPGLRVRWGEIRTIATGAAAALGVFSVGAAVLASNGLAQRFPEHVWSMRSLDAMWEWGCPQNVDIPELGGTFCVFGAPWETAERRALLWGDSNAEHLAPLLELAASDDTAFVLYLPCPAALGGAVRRVDAERPNYVEWCEDLRTTAIEAIKTVPKLDLLVLSASWVPLSGVVSHDGSLPAQAQGIDLVAEGVREVLEATAGLAETIILTQVPITFTDHAACSVPAGLIARRANACSRADAKMWDYYISKMVPLDDRLAAVASGFPDARLIRLGERLCHEGACITEIGGEPLYRDSVHLRRNLPRATLSALSALLDIETTLAGPMPASSDLPL